MDNLSSININTNISKDINVNINLFPVIHKIDNIVDTKNKIYPMDTKFCNYCNINFYTILISKCTICSRYYCIDCLKNLKYRKCTGCDKLFCHICYDKMDSITCTNDNHKLIWYCGQYKFDNDCFEPQCINCHRYMKFTH